jgi:hypothetical protein
LYENTKAVYQIPLELKNYIEELKEAIVMTTEQIKK